MAKRKRKQVPELVQRDGGLCTALVNTASAKRRSVETYAELLAWGHTCGTVTGGDVERLERAAAERPADAEAVARRARELRARFRRILERLVEGRGPTDSDLEALRVELAAAWAARHFARSGIGCRWVWGDRGGDDLDRMLWPVVMSMAEVLSTKYHRKVRRCAGEGCDLLFVDRTPGSPRKWCSRRACGNKVRSRRDYQRRVKPMREDAKRRREIWEREKIRILQEKRMAISASQGSASRQIEPSSAD